MFALDQRCTIYEEDATTGRYTVVRKANARCRLMHLNLRPAATGGGRAELAAIRRLLLEPGIEIPEHAQIEAAGVRWNIVAGTIATFRGPNGAEHHRSCDLRRAA